MSTVVYAFPEDLGPAAGLAAALQCPLTAIEPHRFPDGESRPTVNRFAVTALVYVRLNRPDPKVMPLLLAADALRRGGVRRLVLVAPYLPYLRQDKVFLPGQPLSRDVLGRLLGGAFDRIVTVEPHLHRTADLGAVFGGAPVSAVSVAGLFAAALEARPPPLIVGPDAESAPWTANLAARLGAEHLVLTKQRLGDCEVHLTLPPGLRLDGREVALVDDICASGGTLEAALRELRQRGAERVDILICHALFDAAVQARLQAAGAARILSTDSCAHPTNTFPLAGLLADGLVEELPA